MALPWVRLDSNIASHDKILALIDANPTALAYRAAFSFVCSIGYSGGHGTDGLIPFSALNYIHGNRKTAEATVEVGLWTPDAGGWRLGNFAVRQQTAAVTESTRAAQSLGARKANCHRWHDEGCKCWQRLSAS